KTLIRARPGGSRNAVAPWRSDPGDLYFPHWRRPDGQTGWALWKTEGTESCILTIDGTVAEAFDHLGRPVALPLQGNTARAELGEGILYLIGPTRVAVAR
ncbi:MAG: hypothetical protein JXR77_01010, partial [Lentisphaeria bacterium]|nr:hypothetical protein [Lentisphaeria bacterium]